MSRTDAQTVVIADYDYGDVSIERAIIEGAGLTLVAAQCKTEDEVIDVARDADAIIAQYVTVGAKAIGALAAARSSPATEPAPTSSTSTPPAGTGSW
jgi:D-3-phosphoglycerate dehydrogenase / 2-oxoglutarate reductase